ncbi:MULTISPECIES: copper homeostasis protein CutC [Pantoea]|uniref:copper homeostasis protein CutC n=1 Tax=Pantoea TaxID=53335 RepID=UPI000D70988C|nr:MULTISPECIES: copper homeostasis protein CutC [Pantoea]MDC7866692.1 copper homeostasis protein CutC [Pantoea ananatis]MDC7868079.1 copper homeostasis protein CutC [Pantoea ananatis]PKC40846.1 copper homeostasis protein CutC [Pantoea ananatis BRT98]PWW18926.1 copper homeostasis protein CutC [Pantoea sp. AG702]UEG19805.1 copper homeostasis protein CutC [Pantoea ananatis]
MTTLEICCYGVDCALTAQQAGADRIELCAAPREGGLTPSAGMLEVARRNISVPVHPIVRPRGGDFCYSSREFETMKSDVARIRELGFPGIVLGMLDEDANIHASQMRQIMALCDGMAVTFHRAFDLCHRPKRSLDVLTDFGVRRILTSGQQQSAENGIALLRELNEYSAGPIIMAGAGVRLSNLQKFLDADIREVHSSASHLVASPMRYRKVGVSMCSEAEIDEFSRYCVDGDVVEAMKSVMQMNTARVA